MWVPLLVWLAKQLISYFLKTNLDLSRQLEDAVKRNEQFTAQKKNLDEEFKALQEDKLETIEAIDKIDAELNVLDDKWLELNEKYNEKKQQMEERIKGSNDDDVLRADLPSTSNS